VGRTSPIDGVPIPDSGDQAVDVGGETPGQFGVARRGAPRSVPIRLQLVDQSRIASWVKLGRNIRDQQINNGISLELGIS
jgi:hypothetical protein